MDTTPKPTIILDREWYLADDLKTHNPQFFANTNKSIRHICRNKNIDTNHVLYADLLKSGWKIRDADNRRASMYLSKEYVDEQQILSTVEHEQSPTHIIPAPPIISLRPEERFKGPDGNTIKIEVRGYAKTEDQILFKVKDIAAGFNLVNLSEVLRSHTSGYKVGEDYVTLNMTTSSATSDVMITNTYHNPDVAKQDRGTQDRGKPLKLYLTYAGLLRVLFVSRNEYTHSFRKWATTKLFTAQMGTVEQKEAMAATLLDGGMSIAEFRKSLDLNVALITCIYLICLGTCAQLRQELSIPTEYGDDQLVFKYGLTKDLVRRTRDHLGTYGKLETSTVSMVAYQCIDGRLLKDAENEVKDFCHKFGRQLRLSLPATPDKVEHELVVFSRAEIQHVKDWFASIGRKCSGGYDELTSQLNEAQRRLVDMEKDQLYRELNHTLILERKTHELELLQKDHAIDQMALDRANMEISLIKLQLKLATK